MGVVTTKDDMQGDSNNRGLTSLIVWYSVDHANAYPILNLNCDRMIQTRDVILLRKFCNYWHKNKAPFDNNDKDETNWKFHGSHKIHEKT
jgi:hypothetical protein